MRHKSRENVLRNYRRQDLRPVDRTQDLRSYDRNIVDAEKEETLNLREEVLEDLEKEIERQNEHGRDK